MDSRQLIHDTFTHFLAVGQWPLVREMQMRYGPRVNVRALAADLGLDLVVCQEGSDGRCLLTLGALGAIPDAEPLLSMLARAVRHVAGRYPGDGAKPVGHDDFREALDLAPLQVRQLGALLSMLNGPWSGSSSSPDGAHFSVTPRDDVYFFLEVQSYADLRAVQARLNDESRRISQLLAFGWTKTRAQQARATNSSAGWPKVDRQVEEMRARFGTAATEEQYQTVGLLCREVLISLAAAVYDANRHPILDHVKTSPTDAKRLLEAVIAVELEGAGGEQARHHAKAAVSLADALQHKRTADFRAAALCAEATISVVNLVAIVTKTDN